MAVIFLPSYMHLYNSAILLMYNYSAVKPKTWSGVCSNSTTWKFSQRVD